MTVTLLIKVGFTEKKDMKAEKHLKVNFFGGKLEVLV